MKFSLLDLVVVVAAGECLAIRRPHEERAEDVEDPAELLDRRGTDQDERAAEDQRDDDADHEHFLLIPARHRELTHDEHEDEEVVDRQAVLGEPAGDELPGVLRSGEDPHEAREDQRERDVEDDPEGRLPGRRDMRTLEDQQQIGRQDQRQHDQRADLEPERKLQVQRWAFQEGVGSVESRKSLPRGTRSPGCRGACPGMQRWLP